MVIFEGALIYDETSRSFEWLVETFLRAMYEEKSGAIFTDQAISNVISTVMREVHHRLCVWNMG